MRQTDKKTCGQNVESLLKENEMLRQEVRVARQAGEITADLVAKQFEETDRILSLFQAANAQRKAVLDAATQVSIIAADPAGKITLFNSGAVNMLGYKPDEAVGHLSPLDLHLPGEIEDRCREYSLLGGGTIGGIELFAKYASEENPVEREWTYVKKDGSELPVSLSVTPIKGPRGELAGMLFVAMDLTRRKKAEQDILAAMKTASKYASIGKLTAGISHEIGNPLASISSLVQEIQEVKSPEFAQEALNIVNHHIERIVRIVRSLGDFTRLYSPEKIPSRLGEILESTLNLTRFDKRFKNIEIVKNIDFNGQMRINPDQMQQVFLNLTLNALDAMPDGGRLSIDVKDAWDSIVIIFGDTGCGMDREVADRIFDPFFTTKSPGKGTGLGMSICWGIISEHGGTISVESEKGIGSTFTVRLPKKG